MDWACVVDEGCRVIIYREQPRPVETGDVVRGISWDLDHLPRDPDHDDVVRLLIDLGVLEAGTLDALQPSEDDDTFVTRALRRVTLAAGHLFVASWRRRSDAVMWWRAELAARLHACSALVLPTPVDVRVPQGYAYYGHFPECHLEAAHRLWLELRPSRVVCIGIRNIGTSLSAVVAALLEDAGCRVSSYTVRPRGQPPDRRLDLSRPLKYLLAASVDSHFLLVDEGPGLSGSSLAGAAGALSELGVPDERIVFLPSRDPDPQVLSSAGARARWPRHRRFVADFDEVWLESGRMAEAVGRGPLHDVSAGRWRDDLIPLVERKPAVYPQHERRKLMGRGTMARFVGLGSAGGTRLTRAQDLADAGFSPHPFGLRHGFLVRELIAGTPLVRGEVESSLLDRIAVYLAYLRMRFTLHDTARTDLDEMMEANLADHPMAPRIRDLGGPGHEPPVALDGRMMPHEWLRTARGYMKVDALDHHDDACFPGPVDIAWDVAGAAVEFGMGGAARRALVERYRQVSGDRTIARRLPYYTVAYLAFRIGYASLAVETLGESEDGRRFERLRHHYETALLPELALPPGSSWSA